MGSDRDQTRVDVLWIAKNHEFKRLVAATASSPAVINLIPILNALIVYVLKYNH